MLSSNQIKNNNNETTVTKSYLCTSIIQGLIIGYRQTVICKELIQAFKAVQMENAYL